MQVADEPGQLPDCRIEGIAELDCPIVQLPQSMADCRIAALHRADCRICGLAGLAGLPDCRIGRIASRTNTAMTSICQSPSGANPAIRNAALIAAIGQSSNPIRQCPRFGNPAIGVRYA
ncbi:MAG TPA: hypothetical protein VFV98_12260 [Vicinamibacterales bacterium]|nr:hypothetical protein [Vicinamibacterales bacterium]